MLAIRSAIFAAALLSVPVSHAALAQSDLPAQPPANDDGHKAIAPNPETMTDPPPPPTHPVPATPTPHRPPVPGVPTPRQQAEELSRKAMADAIGEIGASGAVWRAQAYIAQAQVAALSSAVDGLQAENEALRKKLGGGEKK